MKFTFYRQPDRQNCGATCLRMIAKHYGRNISSAKLTRLSETTNTGVSIRNIADAAEKIGFRSLGVKINFEKLKQEVELPCIVHWNHHHFVVVIDIAIPSFFGFPLNREEEVTIADPSHGILKYRKEDFIKCWIGKNATELTKEGVTLLLEPTPKLNSTEKDDNTENQNDFSFIFKYLFRYKKYLIQLIIGLFTGSLLQLLFPFLTQSIVDIGIQNQDIDFIYLILTAQLFLFVGRTSVEVVRGWILLHLSTRINISLISDFFIKLMNLPIAFFDVKLTGDIMQRINDHQRIEKLLTTSSLSVLFSTFNLLIFGGVLMWYSFKIFIIFFIGSIFYFLWIIIFLKKRKEIDYKRFAQNSGEQSKIIELINGMQEIKLHNAEKQKRWAWEYVQAALFKIEIKGLTLQQTQNIGSNFINEIKNILITVLSASLVIDGKITLGMMLSISYIIGQLNNPVFQLVGFIHSVQDAKIALERLSEIHNKEDEETTDEKKIKVIPSNDFTLKDVHFRYIGTMENVINGLNLVIPANKITAIVGTSGSGKTTLMKMLLKFYEPSKGEINFGATNLKEFSHRAWREHVGVVMQEGYIFTDTIAMNIAIGEDVIDQDKLVKAAEIANIKDYIEGLPLTYNTMIGMEGVGMSSGQKQRLLIARAIYKNPKIIFFDEATSSLDAFNEKIIIKNLNYFFKNRTAVIIAHRLSTVKNADQIVVLEKGKIIEKGIHKQLIDLKGSYYNLVKNQLDLE